ncbi:MAG: triosephosphate isomerase, triosephosphate isomerase [Parcubacteria group bacterium]|nr:triosephosphate isomerase, triosephosphate isomerase [Parcubacteria group bacterium]
MKPILVGNWKNHPDSLARAASIASGLAKKSAQYKKLATYIAPPLPYLETVSKKIKGFGNLASQDIFFAPEGTYTGATTPDILKSFGVKLSIIGHSERRALGETNEVASDKIKCALRSGITPLLCVGEKERDAEGEHFEFIREELRLSLEGVRRKDDAGKLIIAYEPVWAIGKRSKEAMQPTDLAQMVIFIKKVLTDIFGREAAEMIPILYGGSVEGDNAKALIETGVNGFLVGHASLDPKMFGEIAAALETHA